ncbi:hypothetical protein KAFR_0E02900 [Kazachstania africana CBS 2517]|uniref:C2H2-type domain-containing protein n=1 Tax=Kazachstania africana (strain ATCC 22294 / BCRC 22015 / CBS 2517 / CECT 1963 / NBRC 1671 / NRRL Y-8276) TaxID=1071382 RepID=H2AVP2_KAZAF|nr:hypothetical protein KAFR_0E02900 [Kazachstania africana CBS 2517]CCF58442.1 hypothetical protein KAFR_0E02900 [Kazachstania africana CBS 2517]
MNEDSIFYNQATDAIISLDSICDLDPVIKELLSRITLNNVNKTEPNDNIPLPTPNSNTYRYDNTLDVFNRDHAATSDINGSSTEKTKNSNKRSKHNKTREYKCLKCDLKFSRSSDLRRHERAHLPILPNICPQCGKGFARKDALKRHFDTLTCKRNRSKLHTIGNNEQISEILEVLRQKASDHHG